MGYKEYRHFVLKYDDDERGPDLVYGMLYCTWDIQYTFNPISSAHISQNVYIPWWSFRCDINLVWSIYLNHYTHSKRTHTAAMCAMILPFLFVTSLHVLVYIIHNIYCNAMLALILKKERKKNTYKSGVKFLCRIIFILKMPTFAANSNFTHETKSQHNFNKILLGICFDFDPVARSK